MSKQPTLFQSWGSVPQKQKSKQDACVKNHTSTLSGHPGMDEMDDDLLLAMAVEESLKELEKQSSPSTNNPSGACHTLSETKKNALVKKQSALLKSVTSSEEGKPDHQSVSKQTIIDEKEAIMPDIDDIEDLPGFDKYAGRMWIYPTNLPVRDYQYSIVKEALFKNTLVVLPTGLGKTFIAAVIMYNFYRWYPQGKVIFMAPTKPLVAQQIEACYNIMGIPQADTAEMTGAMQPSERKIVWQKCRIFFLTPQVLTNDLSRNACPGHAVKCLVVDEAHKALGNHAYCQVVRELVKYSTNFRVLALSATPGTDIKSVQQVIHNLLIAHVELRSEDSKDLQQYTYERKVEKIVVPLDDELKSARDKYLQILEGVVSRLKCYGVLYNREVKSMSKFLILKARDAFRQNPPTNLQHQQVGTIEGDFALCMSLYHGYELLQLHGLRSLYNFLEGIMAGQKACGRTRSELQKNVIFCELFKSLKDKFDHIRSLDPNKSFQSQYVSTDEKPVALGHPKMKCLEKIVLDHFNKKQQELNSSSEPSSRVMIFSQYRDSVDEITEMLNRRRPLVKVMSFVGQSSVGKSNRGFTQKEQLKVMKKFREGGYNTLVSTCVGEEGLDIGDVDLIICFDAHKSPIRLVQRMGRTGRKRKGRIVMLVTEGKEEQIYNQSQFNKRSIHKAILNGTQSLVFYPNNPRMVPNGLNPECHKMHLTVQSVYSVESKGKNVHLQKNKIKDPQQNSHPRRTGKTDSSEIGLLSEEEMQYWSDHYKLPASEMAYLPESEFITLPPCKKNQNANEEGVALSLSEWMPWQNQLQPTLLTGHSDHSKLLVELMEFMALQSVLGEEEDNYGQEMALYLKEDDILKPGESNNSTNENNGILKFCVKKDIDDLKESLPFKPSVRNAKNNRIKHKELPQFDEEPLCLRSDEDELPYIHLNDSDEEQRMYSSEQTTKQYVKSTKSRDEIDHGSEDILKTKQTRTIKSNLGAFLCAEKSSTDKSERRTENNHSPSSQKDLDCVPQLNELKEVSTGIKTPQTTNYEQKTECQSVAVTEKDRCPDDNKKTVTNSRNHVGSREEEDKLSQLLPISSTMLRNIIPLEGEPECIKIPPSLKEMTVTFEQFDKTGHISPVNVLDLVVKWQRPERDDGMLGKTSISNQNQCFMMESSASDAKLDHPGIDIPSVSGDLPECLEESHTTTGLLKKSRQTKQCQLYDTITDTATNITSELKGHEIDNSENHTQPYCINRERMCGNSLQSNSDEVSATRIDTSAFVGVNSGDLAEQFTMESTIKNTELSGSATVNSVYYKSVSCTDSTMKRGQMEKAVEEESESVFTDMSFNVADFESVAVLPNKSQLTFTQALNCLDSTECMSPFISTPGKGEKKKRDIKHALRETNIEDSPSILKEDVGNVEVAPKTNTSVKKDSFQTEQPQFDLGFNLDFDLEEFEDEIIPPSPVHVTRPVSFYHVDKSSFGSENGINTTTGIKNTEAKSTPTEKPCRRTTSPLCNGKPFLNQKSKPVAVIAPSGNAKSEITDRTVNSTDTVSSCSPKGQGVNYSQLPQHERKLFFNGTNQTSIAERSASEKVGSVAKEDEISDDAEESMIKVPRIRLRNNIIESPDAPFEPKIQTSEFNPFKTPLKPALKSYRKMKLKRSRVSSDEDCDTGADEESPVIKTKLKKFTILNESTLTDCTAADAKPNNKPMNREKKPRTLPFEGRMRYSKQKYNNEFIEREAILSGSDGSLSSDESEGSDLDNFDASFINDMSQMSQTCVGGVDMKAIYLQSVRSPANRGQYNITYGKREKQDVFSQVPEQDTEYMEDSFCVPNDFEDTELVDTSTAVSILEPRQIKQQQARFNKFAELRSRKREKEKHLSERRYHSHKNNVDIVNRTYAGKKKGRVQILDSSSEEETTYKHSNNHQVEHLHTEITKLSGERGKSHIGSQRVAPSNSPPIVSMRSTLQKKHCDPVNTSDKRLTTDPSCTVTSSKCPQNAFQHNIRENKVPRMVPLQPSKLVEMPSFSLGLGDILADDDDDGDDDDDDLFANLPLPSNSKCTGASSVTSLETTTTDTVQAYTVSANYKKKPTSVVSPPIQSKEERLRLSRLKQEEFRKKFTQQKTESNTDRSGSDASANSFKVVSSSNKSLETKCGKPYNFADSSPKNSFTNIKDKVIVLVDSREVAAAQCIVSALKFNHNLHVSVKSMGNCDYIVSSRMAIERKTVSDFTNGANKKKLLDRLRLLCELFERPCLIVEKDRLKSGQKETSKSLLCSKYVENVVSSLAQTHIKLLYSDSEDETASLIAALSLQEKKKNMAICFNVELTASQEQVLKFYLSLPKMNYVLALKMMYSFTTISEFIKSPLVVLKKKAGLTDQKAEELFAYVRHKFNPGMIQVSSH